MLLAAFLIFELSVWSQLMVQGEFRPRAEYRDGYKSLRDDSLKSEPAMFVSQRSRILFQFKTEKYETFLSLQDVRVWGDQELRTDEPATAIHQAWVDLKLTDSLHLKLGRQELIYDNQRLFSNNNWNQNGQVFDAALLKWNLHGAKLHFINAFNQKKENTFGNGYDGGQFKNLHMLWLNHKIGKTNVSWLAIADGNQKANSKTVTYLRETFGGVAKSEFWEIQSEISGFYQTGQYKDGTDVSAWYAMAKAGKKTGKLKIETAAEFISGNDLTDTSDTKSRCFDVLYTSGHAYDGNMDYFTNIPKDTKMAGLVDISVKFQYQLAEKHSATVDYHYFALQNNLVNQGKKLDKYLGSEIDILYRYKISGEIQFETGYSMMFGTKTLGVLAAGNHNKWTHWAYAMLTVKPVFLNPKIKEVAATKQQ